MLQIANPNKDEMEGIGKEKNKIYTPPILTIYGNIEEITQGDAGGYEDVIGTRKDA